MSLADIVNITITTESAAVTAAGFGTPLILGVDCPAGFTNRVRFYSTLAEMVTDGFSSSGATYAQAAAIAAQTPRVTRWAVGRVAKPTQRWAVTPVAVNSDTYALTIDGNAVSFTADSSATVTEIIAGLKSAIDGLSLAVTVSDQTTYMRIVANTAGAFHTLRVSDPAKLKLAEDTVDVSMAADLAAIAAEDNSWYAFLCPFHSSALTLLVAAYAEANKKLFIAQTSDTEVIQLSSGSDSSTIADALRDLAYARTALIFNFCNESMADGAWAGKCLPLDPGSETWKFKTLAGVTVSTLTTTQRTNALAKKCNVYNAVAGVNITEEGVVVGGEFIDVVRFRDWLEARMSEEIFGALARSKKIPFTDAGISVIEGIVRSQLAAGIAAGGLSADPSPVVTVPKAAEVSSSDKAARLLRNVKFDATLAGAIHSVQISGTISV